MRLALLPTALLLAAIPVSFAGAAEVGGAWHVTGKVSSFAFTLNCTFRPQGRTFGGVCVDASTNDPKVNAGKAHPLTAGSIDGDKVSWTYQSSFLFTKFNVTYNGTQSGDRIRGTIDAQGHQGDFTATRQ